MNILEKLKEKGYDTVPAEFYSQIDLWKSWYDGDVRGFHDYRVFNGQKTVQCRRYTLGMGKKVAEDWANLLVNERVKITLEGQKEQEFFDSVCKANNFWVKANEMQEMKAGLGTVAYVPRVTNAQFGGFLGKIGRFLGIGKTTIKIDYVTAQNIFPLSWENGQVYECAFASRVVIKGENYLYLQVHRVGDDGNYIIENSLYQNNNGGLREVNIRTIPRFEKVAPIVYTGSPERRFVIDRLNIANNYDNTLPMGIPAFANAIGQLKGVDIAYDSYVNEFVLGKKRIMVKPEAKNDLDGRPFFDTNELTYYVLPEDTANGSIIKEIDMTLRTAEHNAGLQDMLNALSSRCGFGENHYRFDNGSIATATQVISENSTMFRTIKKHEIILNDVLEELARIILRLGNSVLQMGLDEDVEISIDFDDSIIEDTRTELQDMRADVSAGLIRGELYVAKKYGVSEEEARKMMPDMEDLTDDDGQEEIE